MSSEGVWASFPRATWKAIQEDPDLWNVEQVDEFGIVVVVDEEGREVDAIAAPWLVLGGLSVVTDMDTIRAAVETRFPARMEAQRRELAAHDARVAEWREQRRAAAE